MKVSGKSGGLKLAQHGLFCCFINIRGLVIYHVSRMHNDQWLVYTKHRRAPFHDGTLFGFGKIYIASI